MGIMQTKKETYAKSALSTINIQKNKMDQTPENFMPLCLTMCINPPNNGYHCINKTNRIRPQITIKTTIKLSHYRIKPLIKMQFSNHKSTTNVVGGGEKLEYTYFTNQTIC